MIGLDYDMPGGIRDALDNWAQHGWPPGGFVLAVLHNDLSGAVGRADQWSMEALKTIVSYVYNELPSPCWGSTEKVEAWALRHAEQRSAANGAVES